jgi:hypothetical protein
MSLRRIGWLDSCDMPARIHLTNDNGITTICGHECGKMFICGRWKCNSNVPRKIQGQSRYCRVCFKKGGKSLPWIIKC